MGEKISKKKSMSIVVVVEDDVFLAEAVCAYLENAGLNTQLFTEPQEAMDFIQENISEIKIVVSDFDLGKEKNGFDVFCFVRDKKPTLPFFFHSGSPEKIEKSEQYKIFPKPASMKKLVEEIVSS